MSKTIESYLTRLKEELSASNPALVQDALSDAEEHLRTALETALAENPRMTEDEALPLHFAKLAGNTHGRYHSYLHGFREDIRRE